MNDTTNHAADAQRLATKALANYASEDGAAITMALAALTHAVLALGATSGPNTSGNRNSWVTLEQAADYLSCSTATVRRRITDGLPAYRLGATQSLRVRVTDLDALCVPVVEG